MHLQPTPIPLHNLQHALHIILRLGIQRLQRRSSSLTPTTEMAMMTTRTSRTTPPPQQTLPRQRAQQVGNKQTLLESPMLENPPDGRLVLEESPEFEESPDGFVGGFQGCADVALDAAGFVFAGLQEHEAVVVVAGEEQVLPDCTWGGGDLVLECEIIEIC